VDGAWKKAREFLAGKRLFNEAGRGGSGRLVAIALMGAGMIAAVIVISVIRSRAPVESFVAKMPPVNPLPGGPQGDAAQDALLVRHAREEADKAARNHESYTSPIPASTPLKVLEPGADEKPKEEQAPVEDTRGPEIVPVPAPPPEFTPPEKPAKIEHVAAPSDDPEMKKAMADLFSQWQGGPPRTEMVGGEITPARAAVDGSGSGSHDHVDPGVHAGRGKLLVPAGRGIYAHTIVAVDSDTNGPVILEADSSVLAGDRMIGMFSKNDRDRLIVRVSQIEHRGQTLDVRGILIAPDTMEEAVATSVDPHFLERWALPSAAAFMEGLGQAVALSNSTTAFTPFGGTVTSYGPLNFKQQAEIAGGMAAQQIGQTLVQDMPKGPTVKLAANAIVGVMFLSDVTLPAPLVTK